MAESLTPVLTARFGGSLLQLSYQESTFDLTAVPVFSSVNFGLPKGTLYQNSVIQWTAINFTKRMILMCDTFHVKMWK